MPGPRVSIIVVNWNGLKYIEKCIESLLAQTYSNIEIIVVDNHSEDGSREKIISLYEKKILLILNQTNEGFAQGNNRGIEVSKGEYIALLNNDAWADPDWISSLVKTAVKDDRIGMCASKIYMARQNDMDGEKGLLDNTGHLIYPDGLSWGRGRMEIDKGQYEIEEEIIFPSGCAALYKKKMLDEIGFFDERFFAYCEDTDLGLRGRLFGWVCLYCPGAIVYHRFSGSTSGASALKAFLVERNRGWVAVKNLPLSLLLLSPWFTFNRMLWQMYAALTKRGIVGEYVKQYSFFSGIFILIKAYFFMFKGLPAMLKERSAIQRRKKISTKEVKALLIKYQISAKVLALGR